MAWLKSLLDPFKHKEKQASASAPASQAEALKKLEESPETKGMMSLFYRKWKDPAFLKQMKTLAAHMAKDGVNVKSMSEVKAWIEKNKEGIEAGKFNEPPASGEKPGTYVKSGPDVGRNDPCPCGSGKKYKKCCGAGAARS